MKGLLKCGKITHEEEISPLVTMGGDFPLRAEGEMRAKALRPAHRTKDETPAGAISVWTARTRLLVVPSRKPSSPTHTVSPMSATGTGRQETTEPTTSIGGRQRKTRKTQC